MSSHSGDARQSFLDISPGALDYGQGYCFTASGKKTTGGDAGEATLCFTTTCLPTAGTVTPSATTGENSILSL